MALGNQEKGCRDRGRRAEFGRPLCPFAIKRDAVGSDNGIGISPEVKEKMFNPFFTTKPAGEGTGLGLSITHDIIVKQHSGSIEVDSQPGEFTEIRMTLPRTATFIEEPRGRT
jgi:signal transduction histidine kinase